MSNVLLSNQSTVDVHTISTLHQLYIYESKCNLDEEQFVTLLTFYPAMLVVAADGEIDTEEIVYVKHIAKFMANSYGESQSSEIRLLEKEFYAGLTFLYEQQQEWEMSFLQVLRDYLQKIPLLKENIAEVMLMFADSSERVSEDESQVIREVADILAIDISLFDLD